MPGFDKIIRRFERRAPQPIALKPANVGQLCADPRCGGTLQWGSTPTSNYALRCGACKKEPRG